MVNQLRQYGKGYKGVYQFQRELCDSEKRSKPLQVLEKRLLTMRSVSNNPPLEQRLPTTAASKKCIISPGLGSPK